MKLAKNTDLVFTILYVVITVIMFLFTIILFGGGEAILEMVGGANIDDVDPNSPSAGYEMLAKMFGGAVGVIIGILGFFFGILTAIVGVILLIMTIVAFSRRKKFVATGDPGYIKSNLTGKMIFNSIMLSILVLTLMSGFSVSALLLLLMLIGVELILIMARSSI